MELVLNHATCMNCGSQSRSCNCNQVKQATKEWMANLNNDDADDGIEVDQFGKVVAQPTDNARKPFVHPWTGVQMGSEHELMPEVILINSTTDIPGGYEHNGQWPLRS